MRARYPIRWLAYVVMPGYVHVLVLLQASAEAEPTPSSDVLHDLKGIRRAVLEISPPSLEGMGHPRLVTPEWSAGYSFEMFSQIDS